MTGKEIISQYSELAKQQQDVGRAIMKTRASQRPKAFPGTVELFEAIFGPQVINPSDLKAAKKDERYSVKLLVTEYEKLQEEMNVILSTEYLIDGGNDDGRE